jgi:hypothetical protein
MCVVHSALPLAISMGTTDPTEETYSSGIYRGELKGSLSIRVSDPAEGLSATRSLDQDISGNLGSVFSL